ncbi:methionine transporter [Acinetobacter sp. S40]|uniref:MetQ/NlpA family ABC transporter substrate-binding protein n=1 Tax=Acinetobacter sp. S40 TaxID=2767434 RepID=UPI00190CC634|nr:MetQ/NlpA family ABC transporter substrate-binding protein [Acinetobacter sp. S40]MBJ9984956.1 methionine transporter [Acinetobacter sp. S40]
MSQSSSTSRSSNKKLIIFGAIFVILIIGLFIWNKQRQTQNEELVIGISPPFAHPLQAAAKEAEKQGIHVKLVEFSDWNTPNITLNNGDIDANFFQHQPFLNNAIKETGYKLKAFGVGAASHVGLYSKKYKSLDDLPQNARVVIPNDPVNQGRALLLLQQAKLIQLKDTNNYLSKLSDISSNPKNLQFIEVEGPQTARAIDDVDLAFGYPHYLRLAKTADPESALVLDDTSNKRYAILFVVRDDYQDKGDKLKKFVEIYQTSPAVKAALNEDLGSKLWFPGWV